MKMLFVCTGNTCRSPMAAQIALAALRADGGFRDAAVASAGLAAFPGDGATPEAVHVCATHGLDLGGHRAQALTSEMVAAADHVYTMTQSQAAQLRQILPQYAARIEPLLPGADIADPFGGSEEVYARCYAQLAAAVAARLEEWKNERNKGE